MCAAPQATWVTCLPARSVISVGLFLSWKVRVPSCPHLLLPQLYTAVSVTATVWAPPAAIALTPWPTATQSDHNYADTAFCIIVTWTGRACRVLLTQRCCRVCGADADAVAAGLQVQSISWHGTATRELHAAVCRHPRLTLRVERRGA